MISRKKKELLRMGLQSLLGYPMRTVLTMLGEIGRAHV